MAISLSSPAQAALNDPSRRIELLYTFEMADATYAIWTGAGSLVYNSLNYQGGGSAIDITGIEQNSQGTVSELTMKLSAAPDKGLTSDVLATFYDTTWHLRPVTIQIAILDPETMIPITAVTFFRGTMQECPYVEDVDGQRLELKCSSRSIDLSKSGNLYRNASSQLMFDPDDTGLVGIGTLSGAVDRQVKWGQG